MSDQESPLSEWADRAAIQDLVDAWAHCADRRLPERQADLVAPDGEVSVHLGTADAEPAQRLQSREEMVEAFRALEKYDATTHLNGQSVVELDGDRAAGESYCLAHHLWVEDGVRQLMVMSIRYLDEFVRTAEGWRFARRRLVVDWTDRRPSSE